MINLLYPFSDDDSEFSGFRAGSGFQSGSGGFSSGSGFSSAISSGSGSGATARPTTIILKIVAQPSKAREYEQTYSRLRSDNDQYMSSSGYTYI